MFVGFQLFFAKQRPVLTRRDMLAFHQRVLSDHLLKLKAEILLEGGGPPEPRGVTAGDPAFGLAMSVRPKVPTKLPTSGHYRSKSCFLTIRPSNSSHSHLCRPARHMANYRR